MGHKFSIPVKGGTLKLCVAVDAGEPVSHQPVVLSFEYQGILPRDMAMDLVRQTPPEQSLTINGMPVLEFLESL
jgi:hypothetical protein